MYKFLLHQGDVKIKVQTKDDFEFYSDIVNAINETIFDSVIIKEFKKEKQKEIVFESKTKPELLHNFIEELVYISNYNHVICKLKKIHFDVKNNNKIFATLDQMKVLPKNYKVEVKAASFNIIYKENEKTKEKTCEFVLDI